MLAFCDPSVLDIYSRVDIIGILTKYGTPHEVLGVDREV
jgi:hypothetical protein